MSKKKFKNNTKTITETQSYSPWFHIYHDVVLDTFNLCKYF